MYVDGHPKQHLDGEPDKTLVLTDENDFIAKRTRFAHFSLASRNQHSTPTTLLKCHSTLASMNNCLQNFGKRYQTEPDRFSRNISGPECHGQITNHWNPQNDCSNMDVKAHSREIPKPKVLQVDNVKL